MTLASLNARLKKINPALRIRRRTGWIVNRGEGFSIAAIFHGCRYLNIAMLSGDVNLNTRPILYRLESLPGMRDPRKYVHSRQRRGRKAIILLLRANGPAKKRWARQLLTI